MAQLIYVVVFMVELYHLGEKVLAHPLEIKKSEIMLGVLGLIDVVMIANLLIMVIIGISSIHLLKTFIGVNDLGAKSSTVDTVTGELYTSEGVFWQVIIHTVFIFSAVALAWIDKISSGSHTAAISAGPATAEYVTLPVNADAPSERELRAARDTIEFLTFEERHRCRTIPQLSNYEPPVIAWSPCGRTTTRQCGGSPGPMSAAPSTGASTGSTRSPAATTDPLS